MSLAGSKIDIDVSLYFDAEAVSQQNLIDGRRGWMCD